MDYSSIEKAARGSVVRFYMWGGSTSINAWIDGYVAKELKSRYGITLVRVPADARIFVNKLLSEKQVGKTRGTIDLVWINGENFRNANENGLLYGPFAGKLPNFREYVNPDSVKLDFGYPVNGYEAPWGRAQFVFEYDSARIKNPPQTFNDLLKWAMKNPGRFTYPQPPDFTGSAFIRQAFYETTGGYLQYMKGYDDKLFTSNSVKLWKYLRAINPFLWQNGRDYPRDIAALDTLFERGEVDFNMSYHQADAANRIIAGRYPASVRTFVMKDCSIYNTHFTAIAFNAPNKAGAMTVANFLLSPGAQYSKNNPVNWGDFTVLDMGRLPPEWKKKFSTLDLGKSTLPFETLSKYAVPEIPSDYVEKLEDGWKAEILGK
jgi:putative spermidine/putrescine transport system substrate-binding protein